MRVLLPLLASLGLTACASIQPAQVRLPAALAEQPLSRTQFTGLTGWLDGRFAAGSYSGVYGRSEERLAFGGQIERAAFSAFSISGPGMDPAIGSSIDAHCLMDERALDLGIVEVTTLPMAYSCAFTTDGRPIPARFELQEISRLDGPINRYERAGEIALGGEIVQIRSLHQIEGTAIPTSTPIGYLFQQRGRPVGVVELNGAPALIVPEGTDPGLARTLTVAALALGLFQDPANSTLDP